MTNTRKKELPAFKLIRIAGGEPDGILLLSELLKIHRTRPYRWMQPKEKGGTGGAIPPKHHKKIIEIAKRNKWDFTADDLIA